MGRAALRLADDGVDVIFGARARSGRLIGHRARVGGWEPAQAEVLAAYDRYPSQTDPDGHGALTAGLAGTPILNSEALIALCRDKLATQEALADLPQPPIEVDPGRFAQALEHWGAGYLKPRFGAFGRGICRVLPGDPLPSRGPGAVPGRDEPLFLQRAVEPVAGWRGVTCRVLCQRTPDGWWVGTPVARRSREDWVVNAARGSEVVALAGFLPSTVDSVVALAEAVARQLEALQGDILELGVDLAIDRELAPWVLEVNSRPRGRLEALAGADPAAYFDAHVAACCRPLRTLVARYG